MSLSETLAFIAILVAIIAIAVQIATSHATTNITQHFHGPVNGNDVSVEQKRRPSTEGL